MRNVNVPHAPHHPLSVIAIDPIPVGLQVEYDLQDFVGDIVDIVISWIS